MVIIYALIIAVQIEITLQIADIVFICQTYGYAMYSFINLFWQLELDTGRRFTAFTSFAQADYFTRSRYQVERPLLRNEWITCSFG